MDVSLFLGGHMKRNWRLQASACSVIVMSGLLLRAPEAAFARGTNMTGDCGVCFQETGCQPDLDGACDTFCSSHAASGCINGIPGGWVCDGGFVYRSFVFCS
jgi:hypothetical protein